MNSRGRFHSGLLINFLPRSSTPGGRCWRVPSSRPAASLFIASTDDNRFRALDVKTGKELWVDETREERQRQSDHVSGQERQTIRGSGRHRYGDGLRPPVTLNPCGGWHASEVASQGAPERPQPPADHDGVAWPLVRRATTAGHGRQRVRLEAPETCTDLPDSARASSPRYTSLKGRPGRVQAVLIAGPAAIVIAIALGAAWINTRI